MHGNVQSGKSNRAVDPDFPPFLENWYLSARIIRRFELVRLLAIERRLDNNLTEAETGNLRIFFCNGTSKTTTSLERRLTTARRRRQPHDLRLSPGYTAIGLRQEQSATTSSLLTALPQPSTPLPTINLLPQSPNPKPPKWTPSSPTPSTSSNGLPPSPSKATPT